MANAIVAIGAGITLVKSMPAIIVGRFIYGLASGSFSVLVPGFSKITSIINTHSQ
jgi:hypothetical protein